MSDVRGDIADMSEPPNPTEDRHGDAEKDSVDSSYASGAKEA